MLDRPSYNFTSDWHVAHEPVWRALLAVLRPSRVLEIGSFEGRAACFLIDTCAVNKSFEITCVDTWQGSIDLPSKAMEGIEKRFDQNLALAKGKNLSQVTLRKIKKPSHLALAQLQVEEALFDLIYIDGSHTAPDVLLDATMAFPLLRHQGLMIFDDYHWAMDGDLLNRPKIAIDVFSTVFSQKMVVCMTSDPTQCVMQKVAM